MNWKIRVDNSVKLSSCIDANLSKQDLKDLLEWAGDSLAQSSVQDLGGIPNGEGPRAFRWVFPWVTSRGVKFRVVVFVSESQSNNTRTIEWFHPQCLDMPPPPSYLCQTQK